MNLKKLITVYLCLIVIQKISKYVLPQIWVTASDTLIHMLLVSALAWLFRLQDQESIIVSIESDGRLTIPVMDAPIEQPELSPSIELQVILI